jgi:hypothetical protein
MTRLLLLIPALAAAGQAAAAPKHGPTNPNDIICRDLPLSGSRLDSRRVCMTRQQWDDQRREARETIDKAQRQQVNPQG